MTRCARWEFLNFQRRGDWNQTPSRNLQLEIAAATCRTEMRSDFAIDSITLVFVLHISVISAVS